jgi:hypothetical protein
MRKKTKKKWVVRGCAFHIKLDIKGMLRKRSHKQKKVPFIYIPNTNKQTNKQTYQQ